MSEEALKAQIEKLQSEVAAFRAKAQDEKTKRQTMQDDFSQLRADHKAQAAEFATLKKEAEGFGALGEQANKVKGELSKVQAEFDAFKSSSSAEVLMAEKGLPGRVRRMARLDYDDHKTEAGEKAEPFDEWFTGRVAEVQADPSVDPVLSPFLVKPAGEPPPADEGNGGGSPDNTRRPPAPPSVDRGARGTPPAGPAYVPGQIASMPAEDYKAHRAQMWADVGKVD